MPNLITAKIKLRDRWFFNLSPITYADCNKAKNLTDYEFKLLCAYEFYFESPTGQYDDIVCELISFSLFKFGIFIREGE